MPAALNKGLRAFRMLTLLLAIVCLGAGCELNDVDDTSDTNTTPNTESPADTDRTPPAENTPVVDSNVVGTWVLYEGTTIAGNPFWYIHFNPDGTFTISNNPDGSGERVHGTYEVSGNSVTGPFVNPGTGEGHIEATITDGVIQLNFIEHWHTPYKVVPYVGTRM